MKFEAAGIEGEDDLSQPAVEQQLTESDTEVSALCLHGCVTDCQLLAATDARLTKMLEAWPTLSEPLCKAIEAICSS